MACAKRLEATDALCDDLLCRVFSYLGNGAFICRAQRERDPARAYTLDAIVASGREVMDFVFPMLGRFPATESRGYLMGDLFLHSIRHGTLLLVQAVYIHLVDKLKVRKFIVINSQMKAVVDHNRFDVLRWMVGKTRIGFPFHSFMEYAAASGNDKMIYYIMICLFDNTIERISNMEIEADAMQFTSFPRFGQLIHTAEKHGHHSLADDLRQAQIEILLETVN